MTDGIQPLLIPAQEPTPHLEGFVGFDLLLEIAAHPAQMDAYRAAEFFARVSDPAANKGHAEVHAAYVKIGKVGAIRFVQVVVAVYEIGAGGDDHGLEECGGAAFGGEARDWKEAMAKECT